MSNVKLRKEAAGVYESLVKSMPYLFLLISSTAAVVLSIMGNGIIGILTQIIPLLILIGLYLARSKNRTGVKMIQVCATILFWLNCIICGIYLALAVTTIAGVISTINDARAASGGVAIGIAMLAIIFLQYFIPIFYNRDIKLIMKDVSGWFESYESDALPEESRKRVSCKLVLLCIIQLIINGISALYLLAMLTRTSFLSNLGGMFLNEIIGDNSGSQIMSMVIPGPSVFSVLAAAAVITKLICVILLYNQYKTITVGKVPEVKPQPKQEQPAEVQLPVKQEQPAAVPQQKRRVRIIMERKSPQPGRFSASMTSELVVGRREDESKLVIPGDQSISGHHMRLFIRNNKLYAEDMGSHNGIYVNGRKIDKTQQIHRGDEIRLGNSVFILTWET